MKFRNAHLVVNPGPEPAANISSAAFVIYDQSSNWTHAGASTERRKRGPASNMRVGDILPATTHG